MRRLLAALLLAALVITAGLAMQRARTEANYRALIDAGEAALAGGRTHAAVEAFSGALAFRPASMAAHLRRGEAYQRQGALAAAERDLTMAAQLDPSATQPLERLAEVAAARGDHGRAADWYAQAADRDAASARLAYQAGYQRYLAGQIGRAIPPLRRAAGLAPGDGAVHHALGLALRDSGDTAGAHTSLSRAVEVAPALIPAREALAELARATGDTAEHLRQLEALAALDPSVPRLVALAHAAADAGRTDRAVLALGSANDLVAGDPQVRLALGRVWLLDAARRNDRASLRKAAEALAHVSDISTSEAIALRGRLASLSGARREGLRLLTLAVDQRPVWPEAFRFQAEALEVSGRKEEGEQALARYHALAPIAQR